MSALNNIVLIFIVTMTLNIGGMKTVEAENQQDGSALKQGFDYNHPLRHNATEAQRLPTTPVKQRNAELRQQLNNTGGVSSTIGKLAIGGLLGALFFGGAFEHINIFDVIIFTLIAIVLFRLSAPPNRRKQRRPTAASARISADGTVPFPTHADHYREPTVTDTPNRASLGEVRRNADKRFENDVFVEGAENLFRRLQKAWDEGNLADIRQFTTDHVFAEIQDQYHQRTHKASTEIVTLKTELLNTNHLDFKQEAIVLFEAQLDEDNTTTHVHEVWHFTRPANSTQSTWFLDGIQQVQ